MSEEPPPPNCQECGKVMGFLAMFRKARPDGSSKWVCAGCNTYDAIRADEIFAKTGEAKPGDLIKNIRDFVSESEPVVKGEDFVFTKHMPDIDDLHAESRCAKAYFENPQPPLEDIEYFMAGFNRGVAWAKAKYGIK